MCVYRYSDVRIPADCFARASRVATCMICPPLYVCTLHSSWDGLITFGIRFHPLLGWPCGLLAMIKCSMKHRGLKTAIADLLTNPSLLTP